MSHSPKPLCKYDLPKNIEFFETQFQNWPSPKDNRLMFNGILWIARNGATWRDIPERFGSWKTVYSRFCKWRDDKTLTTVFYVLNTDANFENLSIDSTIIKAYQHSAGAKKGL